MKGIYNDALPTLRMSIATVTTTMVGILRHGLSLAFLAWLCPASVCAQGTLQYLAQFSGDRGAPVSGVINGPGGKLYGTALNGGRGYGSVFRFDPASPTSLQTVYAFNGADGHGPVGRLLLASDGNFYGTTQQGGANNKGTVFKLTPAGVLTTLVSFTGANGEQPRGGLMQASDGNIYGTTQYGGDNRWGTIFRITPSGSFFLLVSLGPATGISNPAGGLVEGSDGALYGTASNRIYRFDPATAAINVLYAFTDQSELLGSLIRGSGGVLFGASLNRNGLSAGTVFKITESGVVTPIAPAACAFSTGDITLGSDGNLYVIGRGGGYWVNDNGCIYRVAPNGNSQIIVNFNLTNGSGPAGPLLETSPGVFYGTTGAGGSPNRGVVFRLTPNTGSPVTVLHEFGAVDGQYPTTLIRASAGGFFGMTRMGGGSGHGTVFRITAAGVFTTLRSFAYADLTPLPSSDPDQVGVLGIVEGRDGNLYGSTYGGYPNKGGTVFKLAPNGTLTRLAALDKSANPAGPVTQGTDGALYGITAGHLSSSGAIDKVTLDGTVTTVTSFTPVTGSDAPGDAHGELVQGADGNFYGVSNSGGTAGRGTVFKVSEAGALSTLASFNGTNGSYPSDRVVVAADGNVYGVTLYGGPNETPTVFRVTPSGVLTTLAVLDSSTLSMPDFSFRMSPVVTAGPDGNLYAATPYALFRVTPAGVKTKLRTFTWDEGAGIASLIAAGPREFYGTAVSGAPLGGGSVFHLTDVAPVVSSAYSALSPLITPRNTAVSGAVTATDADDAAGTLTFRIVTQGAKGVAAVNAVTGAFTYTPLPGARGRDAFTITTSDPFGDGNVVAVFVAIMPPPIADRDGDGRADMTVYDAASGRWRTLTSTSDYATPLTTDWGGPGYTPVPGDYDGDGFQDVAAYNNTTGAWNVVMSGGGVLDLIWGGPGYRPVAGDYDGDGRIDPAVYHVSSAQWSVLLSSTNYTTSIAAYWGGGGYVPVPGQDFDGDLKADAAVYSQSAGTWYVLTSSTNYTTSFSQAWGGVGYTLVPGDYDGDGKADLGVYRRSTGTWSILLSGANFTTAIGQDWGGVGYFPIAADFDGDGKADLGAFQQATGNWYVLLSGAGFTTSLSGMAWGATADQIISTTIIPAANDVSRASDVDNDGKADITVYNPTSGAWSSLLSAGNHLNTLDGLWGGGNGYTAAPGDYDGDGRTDRGVYENATGKWTVLLSSDDFTTAINMTVGGSAWSPMPGDYDGDGKTDFAVYNATTAQWFGLKSSTQYTTSVVATYGGPGYTPITGDFDGDGKTDLGVYQASSGNWSILLAAANYTTSITSSVGGPAYVPAQGDYDGDGKTDFVVYNPASGLWYGLLSTTSYTTTVNVTWGGAGYTPVQGDYDGDGRTDLALYVPATGNWYILLSGAHYTTSLSRTRGGAGYMALPRYP